MNFTSKAKTALNHAAKMAKTMGHGYVGSEHILVGLLKQGSGVAAKVLLENGADEKKIIQMIKDMIAPGNILAVKDKEGYSPRAQKILDMAGELALHYHEEEIGTRHILLALIKEGNNVALRILQALGIAPQKVYVEILASMGYDQQMIKEELPKSSQATSENQKMLSQYARDITSLAMEDKLDPVIGREDEIVRVIQIICRRTKNNPCLIGEPGVGKTAIVEGLAQRIVKGQVPDIIKNKRVMSLDLSQMVAGSKYRGEFEERIKRLMKEVVADGNIILFLDEIHTIIGAGGAEGALDAANILKPSLSRGELQLIGATTIEEYRKHIEKDAALERRFQTVMVEEPDMAQATEIVMGIKHKYEEHHKVSITADAVEAAVKLSMRYLNDRNLPDKAIDLIDEAGAAVSLSTPKMNDKCVALKEEMDKVTLQIERALKFGVFSQAHELRLKREELSKKYESAKRQAQRKAEKNFKTVTEEDIAQVVSRWAHIPLNKLEEKESARLMALEKTLHKKVIGQNEAVEAVARAIRRGRVGLADPNRPIGSFLFLGPTGVGKTELSKALAQVIFGSANDLIRVDMSEYMESHSVSRMIGSPPGYVGHDDGGQLSEKVRRNPYSVVLFDEIEKAHPDVFNILLQVLDDGHITDSKGRKVNFKNTIIIMTSNAVAQRIVEPKNLGFATKTTEKENYEKMKSGVMEEVKRLFKPEFINRIDEIMVFKPLNEEQLGQIVTLLASDLVKRCKENLAINLSVSPALKKHLVKKYCDIKMGARPLKRAIQTAVEDEMASEILLGNIKQGDKVLATVKNEKVIFKVDENSRNLMEK